MIPLKRKRKGPLNDKQGHAVSAALHKTYDPAAFSDVEKTEEARLERLIDQMKDFEGSARGGEDDGVQSRDE